MTQGRVSSPVCWLYIYLELFTRFSLTRISRAVSVPHSYFVVAMSSFENDREMLRLISAFKEIESPGMRRAIVLLVEELAQKRELVRKAARKDS